MITALALMLAGVVLWPFVREGLRTSMDTTLQAHAPGDFAMLSGGGTHYRWDGPEGGPVLVLVHGLTSPCYIFDAIVPGLNALGFRTLRYDLYGRGFSDLAPGDQDEDYFCTQLDELLAALRVTGRVSLMGYSMGGMIAASFAARDADRVEHLALIAPAGMVISPDPVTKLMRQVPFVGDWACRWLGARKLRADIARGPLESALKTALMRETDRRGYMPAVLSSLRHMLADDQQPEHQRLARAALPVMAVWGAEDAVIPLSARDLLAQWNPEALQITVEGADHTLPATHPDAIVQGFAQLSDDFL